MKGRYNKNSHSTDAVPKPREGQRSCLCLLAPQNWGLSPGWWWRQFWLSGVSLQTPTGAQQRGRGAIASWYRPLVGTGLYCLAVFKGQSHLLLCGSSTNPREREEHSVRTRAEPWSPKEVHVLVPRTTEHVNLRGKRFGTVGGIKLRIWAGEIVLGYLGGPNVITRVLTRGK